MVAPEVDLETCSALLDEFRRFVLDEHRALGRKLDIAFGKDLHDLPAGRERANKHINILDLWSSQKLEYRRKTAHSSLAMRIRIYTKVKDVTRQRKEAFNLVHVE